MFQAQVLNVLIASPSDVDEERSIVTNAIHQWNSLHSKEKGIILRPLRWEIDSTPSFGSSPQEILNRSIVDEADALIGVFWTRLGTPTEGFDSGTVEEIERVARRTSQVLIYFSRRHLDPDSVDTRQIAALRGFKEGLKSRGLIEEFSSGNDLADKLNRHIERTVREYASGIGDGVIGPEKVSVAFDTFFGVPAARQNAAVIQVYDVIDIDEVPETNPSEDMTAEELEDVFDPDESTYYDQIAMTANKNRRLSISFEIVNDGTIGLQNVFIQLQIHSKGALLSQRDQGLFFRTERTIVSKEEYERSRQRSVRDSALLEFDVGSLQPGRTMYGVRAISIRLGDDESVRITTKVFADILQNQSSSRRKCQLR